jgi:hypothetical protein
MDRRVAALLALTNLCRPSLAGHQKQGHCLRVRHAANSAGAGLDADTYRLRLKRLSVKGDRNLPVLKRVEQNEP